MFDNWGVTCPVCGAELTVEKCAHVVGWMGKNGFCSPLEGVALPWLSGAAVRRTWSAVRVAEAFGDLAPLMDEYGSVADWRPGLSARVLWPLLAEYLDAGVSEMTSGSGEESETVWCAADPEAAVDEARAIAALLGEGYAYLSQLASGAQAAPAAA